MGKDKNKAGKAKGLKGLKEKAVKFLEKAVQPEKKKQDEKKKDVRAASATTPPATKVTTVDDFAKLLNSHKASEWDGLINLHKIPLEEVGVRTLVDLLNSLNTEIRMDFIKLLAKRGVLDTILLNISQDDILRTELEKNTAQSRDNQARLGVVPTIPFFTDDRMADALEKGRYVDRAEAEKRARNAKKVQDIFIELLSSVAGHSLIDFMSSLLEDLDGQKNIIEFIKLTDGETFSTYIQDIDDYIQLNKSFSLETRKQLMDATLLRRLKPHIDSFQQMQYFFLSTQIEELRVHFIKNVDINELLSLIPDGQFNQYFRAIGAVSEQVGRALTEREDYKEVILPCIVIDNIKNEINEYKHKLAGRKDKDSSSSRAKVSALTALEKTLKITEEDRADSKKLAAALTKFEGEFNKPATKKAFHDPGILKFLRAIANFLSAYRHESQLTPHKKTFKHQVKRQLATSHALFSPKQEEAATSPKGSDKKAKK